MSQECHRLQLEFALGELGIMSLLSQGLEHNSQVFCVLLSTLQAYKYIIDKHNHEGVKIRPENLNQVHKSYWALLCPKNITRNS